MFDSQVGRWVRARRFPALWQMGFAVALSGPLFGCMGPEVMIATNVASAALQAAVEHAEKNRPTPTEAWRTARRAYLEDQSREGNPAAQYALGQLHQMHRMSSAAYWICEAANKGHAAAQVQLGHWRHEDRLIEDPWPFIDLRPDNVKAYMWYRLAETNGDESARLFSEPLATGVLSADELAGAEVTLASWSPGACEFVAAADLQQAYNQ